MHLKLTEGTVVKSKRSALIAALQGLSSKATRTEGFRVPFFKDKTLRE